jgi:hypothetical protein
VDAFYDDDGLSRYPEQARLSRGARSPIPMVQREEYGSRLHEDFSDLDTDSRSSSDTRSDCTSTVHPDHRHSRSETVRGRSRDPVILDASPGDVLVTEGNYDAGNQTLSGRTPPQVRQSMPMVDEPYVLQHTLSREIPSSYDLRSSPSEVRAYYLILPTF